MTIAIGPRAVRLSHLDRVVWPETGTTKGELIEYLVDVAPVLLPHLRGRPVMLWRFPEGIDGPGWFQAQCRSRPSWVATHDVIGTDGRTLEYCLVEEPATLAWLANLGTIELHPHGWTVDRPTEPTAIVFDLDPGPLAGLPEAATVGLRVRDRLVDDGFRPVVKTSGSLGLHVAASVAHGQTFERAKAYARSIADDLAGDDPALVIARSRRSERAGRVYVDWIQNDHNRQLIAPYSPRATPIPNVSTPLVWDDVERAAGGDLAGLRPMFREVLERIEEVGDPWRLEPETAPPIPDVSPVVETRR